MTLDPGHFHAALIQKTSYENIDSTVDVYAPEGPEVNTFLKSIDAYNSRENNPTNWSVNTHLGDNYLQQMISEKPGNVMVVSGKNSKKIDYIHAAVKAGLPDPLPCLRSTPSPAPATWGHPTPADRDGQ